MIRTRGLGILLSAGFALAPTAATAITADDVDPFALSPEQLFQAEVISASRSPEAVWDAAAAIYVVTAAEIERSGATSIPEALRLVPGVQVARFNSSGWAVSVRGFNSALANKLLVLIDGREIYDPLFSGVYWDIQDTMLEDIERIEVIRGPGASLWGANAVNGVINIITRSARDTEGTLVSALAGNTEHGTLSARYGAALGERGHWRVYGRVFDRDGQELLAGGDDNSDWQAWRGGFRVDLDLSPRDAVTLQGDIYRSETGQYRNAPSLSPPYGSIVREDINAEGGNILARWTRDLDNEARLTAQAYLDITRREQFTLADKRTTFDLDLQYEFPTFGAHDLIAGVRYRHTEDEVIETEIIRSGDDVHTLRLLSAFVQDDITLSERWRLTLGSKFDENDYTGLEIQPNVRLQWMGDTNMVWASASRAVRTPSELDREFNILFAAAAPLPMDTRPLTLELLPNPDFDSEEVVSYELGYRRQWSSALAMDVALFHSVYDGLATLTPLAPQIPADPPRIILVPLLFTNSTDAETSGAELVLDWRPRDNIDVTFAYSYLDMELDGPPPGAAVDAEAAEGQSPANQASLRVHWAANDRIEFDGALYYVDELLAFGVDAYTRADLRVAFRLSDQLVFDLVGQNLFEDEHREFGAPADANAATIGSSYFGRLTWRR